MKKFNFSHLFFFFFSLLSPPVPCSSVPFSHEPFSKIACKNCEELLFTFSSPTPPISDPGFLSCLASCSRESGSRSEPSPCTSVCALMAGVAGGGKPPGELCALAGSCSHVPFSTPVRVGARNASEASATAVVVVTDDTNLGQLIADYLHFEAGIRKVFTVGPRGGSLSVLMRGPFTQVNDLCRSIRAFGAELGDAGFDLVGYGQAGLVARGYLQMCNHPAVRRLVLIDVPNIIGDADPRGGGGGSEVAADTVVRSLYRDYVRHLNLFDDGEAFAIEHLSRVTSLDRLTLIMNAHGGVLAQPPQSAWFLEEPLAPGPGSPQEVARATSAWARTRIGIKELEGKGKVRLEIVHCPRDDKGCIMDMVRDYVLPNLTDGFSAIR